MKKCLYIYIKISMVVIIYIIILLNIWLDYEIVLPIKNKDGTYTTPKIYTHLEILAGGDKYFALVKIVLYLMLD